MGKDTTKAKSDELGDASGLALRDLADASQMSERTIRFYIVNGLLLGADGAGPQARYPAENLDRLRKIALAQEAGWQLARVREWFERGAPEDEAPRPTPRDRGPDRRSQTLSPAPTLPWHRHADASPPRVGTAPREKGPVETQSGKAAAFGRSSWQRLELEPGVELHVRRPLTTAANRRVRRLVELAKLLGEESFGERSGHDDGRSADKRDAENDAWDWD